MSSNIPEEVYFEILSRLPVKSTFVCKCVCKSWSALISSPSFVNMHYNLTTRKNNPAFMLQGFHNGENHDGKKKAWVICSIGYDKFLSSMNQFDDAVTDMGFPLELFYFELLGYFNGIVFLSNPSKRTLCLWNPATKEYKDIPRGLPESLDHGKPDIKFRTVIFGLGYHYKVVYVYRDVIKDISFAKIYTLGSNSWKNIQTVPYLFCHPQRSGVLSNGALHWFGKLRDTSSSNVIISLDMSEEKFKELQLPNESLENNYSFISMGELKGCLFILVGVPEVEVLEIGFVVPIVRVEVWVMEDYGVQESWTKRYIITHEKFLKRTYYSLQLMWVFENDEILFTFNGELAVYDLKSGSYNEPKTKIVPTSFCQYNYVESLVSLHSGTFVGGKGKHRN